MKILTYDEMLSFEEAKNFKRKDNPHILADYLVRRLHLKKLKDFDFDYEFTIDAPIAKLIFYKTYTELIPKSYTKLQLLEIFKIANSLQDNPGIVQEVSNLANSTSEWAKSGFKMADEKTLDYRKSLCNSCEFWDAKARKGLGKCIKCGCTALKLKIKTSKCPIKKW